MAVLQWSVDASQLRDTARNLLEPVNRAVFSLVSLALSLSILSNNGASQVGIQTQQYLLGLGIGDITGPVVETNMMGYASPNQTNTGLHMRQRSRAWIVADGSNPSDRIVFINADIAMGDTGIRRSIVSALSAEYPDLYNDNNVAIVSTHSHAGVGGYLENLLPQLTALGYVKQTADAIVTGTVLAVQRAHENLSPGSLTLGNTTVLDGNVNRSPSAYLANPASERARYQYDQEKDMSLLRFNDADGNARGFISFFPVHGTSLYNNNTLVNGDNKGMAAYLYEAFVEPDSMPGSTSFVAGFTQSNVGDTSPNTLGPVCQSPGQSYDGQPCDFETSTCGNRTQDCIGRGPGFRISDFESNRIIAQVQFEGAKALMSRCLTPVSGPVKYVHTYLNMASHSFQLPNGTTVKTCPAALGYSFAAGTTDGPGAFDFTQGNNSTSQNPLWEMVKAFVSPPPTDEQKACQAPKPILLNTGYAHFPYEWSPSTVNIQILRIGQLVMLVVPGELTTMAGRRLREVVRANLISNGIIGDDAYVLIAGPANSYAHYVTTIEEYGMQRYEGASTIFGPYTLDAYIEKYGSLVNYLAPGSTGTPPSDAPPVEQTSKAISFQTGVSMDNPPLRQKFGGVLVTPLATYKSGDIAFAQFVAANPRNNLRLEQTFLTVDRLQNNVWTPVRSDSHPSTTFEWLRTNSIAGYSTVNITWTIEPETPAGTYRFSYYGDSKPLMGRIAPFVGSTDGFTVS